MKSKALFFSLVSFLFLVNLVYADLTVEVSLSSKSLTENEQVTVTVAVTNSEGTESNIQTELSGSPTWFSLVQTCGIINSLSAGASGTSICIIKPTSTGTDMTLTARSEAQDGTANTGSTSGINVASQSSSLTASISASSSVGTSATFYVGTTVTAPSANDVVNARATISTSGECTVDTSNVPAQQSLGNVTKGTSKSPANWRLTSSSSSGTCSVTVNVVSDVGGSASPSKSITVGTPSTPTSTATSAITGQSVLLTITGKSILPKVTLQKGKATIAFPSIITGKFASIDIDKTEDMPFRKVAVYVKNSVENIQVTIAKLDNKPASITQTVTGNVYHYIQVDKNVSDENVSQVVMRFEVEKSWISANGIDESTVALYRYADNAWNKLQTTKLSDDSDAILYEATSPGLSVFAISGEGKVTLPGEQPPVAEQPSKIPAISEIVLKREYWKIGVIIVIFAGALFALAYLLRKKAAKKSKLQQLRKRF